MPRKIADSVEEAGLGSKLRPEWFDGAWEFGGEEVQELGYPSAQHFAEAFRRVAYKRGLLPRTSTRGRNGSVVVGASAKE